MPETNVDFWKRVTLLDSGMIGRFERFAAEDYERLQSGSPSVAGPVESLFQSAVILHLAGRPESAQKWMRAVVQCSSMEPGVNDRALGVCELRHAHFFARWYVEGRQCPEVWDGAFPIPSEEAWLSAPFKRVTSAASLVAWTLIEKRDTEALRWFLDKTGVLAEPSQRVPRKPPEPAVLRLMLALLEGREEFNDAAQRALVLFMQENVRWQPAGPVEYSAGVHGLKWAHARALFFTGSTDIREVLEDIKMPDVTLNP